MTNMLGGLKRVFLHPLNQGHFLRTAGRIVWWLINRRFFQIPVAAEMIPGVRLLCYPNSSYGSLVVYTGLPEYAEQLFMYTAISLNDTVIDVGAHIGSESVLLGSKITTGKVHAFEPTPAIFKELQANISLNKLEDHVEAIKAAVSDTNGMSTFFVGSESETNGLTKASGSEQILVKTITLDDYCRRNKIRKISLLKIDVEGAEIQVIRGLENLLKNKSIELIVFEVNDQGGATRKDNQKVQTLLKETGYALYTITDRGKLQNYDPSLFEGMVHNVVAVSPKISTVKKNKWGI